MTLPLAAPVIEARTRRVDEMAHKETFRGYGPEQGYDFLREAIQKYYAGRGVELELGEIFVSDGAKSDLGNSEIARRCEQHRAGARPGLPGLCR